MLKEQLGMWRMESQQWWRPFLASRYLINKILLRCWNGLDKSITFLKTVRFKNELERNITIKLGYANAKIYKCEDDSCPRPACYKWVFLLTFVFLTEGKFWQTSLYFQSLWKFERRQPSLWCPWIRKHKNEASSPCFLCGLPCKWTKLNHF